MFQTLNIGGGRGGGAQWGHMPPQSYMQGVSAPHKILQRQVHYSGICGHLISEEVMYMA